MPAFVVAIDGPAGAGKSTVARELARRLGFSLLDTGAVYRAVALLAAERGVAPDDDRALLAICADVERDLRFVPGEEKQQVSLGARDVTAAIRAPDIGVGASIVSARPAVRAALLGLQRAIGQRPGGVVAEGRDMGTVVFPDAALKLYLDASPEERARRRAEELRRAGRDVTLEETQRAQEERDRRDAGRLAAPLRQAEGALYVDTTGLSIDDVIERLVNEVGHRSPRRAP